MTDATVLVLGDAVLDVQVVPADQIRPGGDVPAAVTIGPGGQGANVAVRLARRGVRTRLVTRIGDDAAGDLVRRSLAASGVELMDLGASGTGAVVVLVDVDGSRTMLSQRVSLLEPGVPSASVLDADWLVVSGYVLLEKSAGISATGEPPRRVVAGCSLDPEQAERWERATRSLSPHLVVLNEAEASALVPDAGGQAHELSRRLGERLGAVVVVTHPFGATATLSGENLEAIAPRSAAVVDTTGAGDAFTAGLVAGLLEVPWPPLAAELRPAMAAAAELASAVTGVPGAQGRVAGERATS